MMAGSGHTPTPTALAGIQVQTSLLGTPIPLGWGRSRIGCNLIDYVAFKAIPKTTKSGGKGGGKTTTYSYTASVILALSEGPISGIPRVFRDSSVLTLDKTGLSVALGTDTQAPWGYMTSLFPDHALGYSSIAYAYAQDYSLGEGAQLSNHGFEVDFAVQIGVSGEIDSGDGNDTDFGSTLLEADDYYVGARLQFITGDNAGESRYVTAYTSAGGVFVLDIALPFVTALEDTFQVFLGDADPAEIITDYLTNPSYGVTGWAVGLTGDYSDYSDYCRAANLLLSPVLMESTPSSDFLTRIAAETNSEFFWSGGLLKIKPYGDLPLSHGDSSWSPDLTPVYELTEDDFLEEVQMEILDQSDAYNYHQIEYLDRKNQYQPATAIAQDLDNILLYGLRKKDSTQYHDICDSAIAQTLVQLSLQRNLYIRDKYYFKLPEDFVALDPMDYVTLTTTTDGLKLEGQLVLIKSIEENEEGELSITAEGVVDQVSSADLYATHPSLGDQPDVDVAPGPVNNPVVFIPPPSLLGMDGEVWIAAAGLSDKWGGCQVWVSVDDASYQYVGDISGPARYGVLTASLPLHADPDTTNTLSLDLSDSLGVLDSASVEDMDSGATLSLIDDELISYQNATLTSAYHYDLQPLRRGLMSTTPAAHSSGASFVRLDSSIFKYNYKSLNVGNLIYVKLVSFNIYGRGLEDISTITPQTLTLSGLPGLGDGTVTTPSLAANAVTEGDRATPSGALTGSGAYVTAASLSLSLLYDSEVDIFGSLTQVYSGAVKGWGIKILVDGVVVKEDPYATRSGYTEAVSIQRTSVPITAAGSPHTIELQWKGEDSTVTANNRDLSLVRRSA